MFSKLNGRHDQGSCSPVFFPIRAESKTHSSKLILSGKSIVNQICDGESIIFLSNQPDSKWFLQIPPPEGRFCHNWVISSCDHCCLSAAVCFDGCHWPLVLFSVQMGDQCSKCWVISHCSDLMALSPLNTTPDTQVVIRMPRVAPHSESLFQTLTYPWTGHCHSHLRRTSSHDFCLPLHPHLLPSHCPPHMLCGCHTEGLGLSPFWTFNLREQQGSPAWSTHSQDSATCGSLLNSRLFSLPLWLDLLSLHISYLRV